VNGFFYQVANVTNQGGNITLDLETQLKDDITALVIMENVITVLDRGNVGRP
jgi:hypothetical protein